MVSEREFLNRAQTLVARFKMVKGDDPLPRDLAQDLENLKRGSLAFIEARLAELDYAIGTLDLELNAGRLSKERHKRLYSDFTSQKSDLESDSSVLALGDGRDYARFLIRQLDERKYGSYDNRPKFDPKKLKEELDLKKAADDGMLMWAWAAAILVLGCAVMFGILSGRWFWVALLLAAVYVLVAVTSAIAFASAKISQVDEVTSGKAVVFIMSSALASAIVSCVLYVLLLFGFYLAGPDSFNSVSDLGVLEGSLSAGKVLVHSMCVVANFVVCVVCARRVFSTSLEKAVSTVILGYVMGIVAWIVAAVFLVQYIMF